jgi:6-pyruvoyltetrahydropterin/6-carboxytetrahydropterin synthase
MYRVAVRKDFIAQHYLVGGDWGAENLVHSHHYVLELELTGETLDQHNYLVDIVDIDNQLKEQVDYYRDRTLNDLVEFKNTNPSLEHFARVLCEALSGGIVADNIRGVNVRLWENDLAWAGFTLER